MGGRGVTIHIAVQSRAQLEQRWGRDGAAAILNNAGTVLVYGGTRDPDDLDAWTKLAGERVDDDLGLVPVLSPAQIAQLPERRVLIIRRATPVAVGTVRMAWRRRDVRHARRVVIRTATPPWPIDERARPAVEPHRGGGTADA